MGGIHQYSVNYFSVKRERNANYEAGYHRVYYPVGCLGDSLLRPGDAVRHTCAALSVQNVSNSHGMLSRQYSANSECGLML